MRRGIFVFFMVGIMVVLSALTINAQAEKPLPQLYYILEVAVKPCMLGQYETAVKEMITLNKESQASYGWYGFSADDFVYYFSIPVKNLADVENMYKEDEELSKKWGEERSKEIEKSFAGTFEYVRTSMIYERNDLSYVPEEPRLKSKEANYRLWVYYYVKPDKDKEFQEILKKFTALCKERNVTGPFSVYTGGMGLEAPVYIVAFVAQSAGDFWPNYENAWKLLGEEGKSLLQKLFTLIRKRDIKTAWYRPGLSYMPEKK